MRPARLLVASLLLALAPTARAERTPLEWNLSVDAPVTAAALIAWGGSEAMKARLAPDGCRVCGSNAFDEWARDRLLWDHPSTARHASDAIAYAVLPAGVAIHALAAARAGGDRWSEGFADVLVIGEAAALAGTLGQAVKLAVARERPFALHGGASVPPDPDDHLSFWSGHTSLTFSLAVAAGTVAHLRGDPSAPWVLGGGLALAAATGWLRIAGDKHWLTDVLAGAAVGSAVGWAVPWLLHRSDRDAPPGAARVAVTPLPLGLVVTF